MVIEIFISDISLQAVMRADLDTEVVEIEAVVSVQVPIGDGKNERLPISFLPV